MEGQAAKACPTKWYDGAQQLMKLLRSLSLLVVALAGRAWCQPANHPIVLHAARLLDVETGKVIAPGEVLVRGDRIAEVGVKVSRPADAETIDLGDRTLLPGLIDAHVHLFLHPRSEEHTSELQSLRHLVCR